MQPKDPPPSLPPIFDLSALSAVQTVFEPQDGLRDPWGIKLAGSFANLIVFSDKVRVILPSANNESTIKSITQPSIIHDLNGLNSDFLEATPYSTHEHLEMTTDSMIDAAKSFDRFARQNKSFLTDFCKVHTTDFIRQYQQTRIKKGTTYDVSPFRTNPLFVSLES